MVRLQKRFAYKYKDREHYKHVVTIPDDTVDKLGWKAGEEIDEVIHGNRLVLVPAEDKRYNSIKSRNATTKKV